MGGKFKCCHSSQAKDDPLADIRKHLGCDGVRKYMREDKSKRDDRAAAVAAAAQENGVRGREEGKITVFEIPGS